MMIICCKIFKLEPLTISDIANILIACANVLLAGYVFIYQKNKDIDDKLSQKEKDQADKLYVLKNQEQNIRLLWFKELIVQPHLAGIITFYKNMHGLEAKLSNTITDEIKHEISQFIKHECSSLRKSFIDILRTVDPKLHSAIQNNIDTLLDHITNKLFDPGLNLNDRPTYEREVGSKISYSHNDLISKLYSYKGV